MRFVHLTLATACLTPSGCGENVTAAQPSSPKREPISIASTKPVATRPANIPLVDQPMKKSRTAVSCTHADGTEQEIYIIDDHEKLFYFYNRQKRAIEPICLGGASCNWNYTENRISFDDPTNGFVLGATLDRSAGTLVSKYASEQSPYDTKICRKIAMPATAPNRF